MIFVFLILLAASFSATANTITVPGASGDWPQWRGGPQQTGYQSLPGRITLPYQIASYDIGGVLTAEQMFFTHDAEQRPMTVIAPSGSISAYRGDGTLIWTRTGLPHATLVGTYDFHHDGHLELLTCAPGGGPSWLRILSLDTGAVLWSSPTYDGAVGAVKAADVDGDGAVDLVWAPAASSDVRAYSFVNGFNDVAPMWETTIDDYVSDPYSYSPMVIGDIDGDGEQEIIITGGRHRVSAIELAGRNGAIIARQDYFSEELGGRLQEGGGLNQLLQLRDIDGDGKSEIVMVSAYGSADVYMFQGIAVLRPPEFGAALIRDCYPAGPRYAGGALRDFDGDGVDDLVVSQWNVQTHTNQLQLVDLMNMQTKATADGYLVLGIVSDAAGAPIILARASASESGGDNNGLTAFEIRDGNFHELWSVDFAGLFYGLIEHDPRQNVDNPGLQAITFDATGDGGSDLLLRSGNGVEARDVRTGRVVGSYGEQQGEPVSFVKRSAVDDSLFVMFTDGNASILAPGFSPAANLKVPGYLRLFATNNHGGAVAMAADLDGDGRNEIYASTSSNNLLRIDVASAKPSGAVVFQGTVPLQPVAVRDEHSLLLKSCGSIDNICRLSDGLLSWNISLPDDAGGAAIPTSINIGRRSASEQTIFTSGSNVAPLPVHAYDAKTGEHLWTSEYGTAGDGTFAVFDFNHDGVDDVAFNSTTDKAIVINGIDGSLLSAPALLPPYGVLGYVDYNGVPVAIDVDGSAYVLDVEDNAHIALLRPAAIAGGMSEVIWAEPQAAIDDERRSMAAVAPDLVLGAIVATGSRRGVLLARDIMSGRELWRHELYHGAFATSDEEHALGSVIAVDVDGQNGPEFVVGSDDGYLYAVNAWSGKLVWSMNLGYPAGDPIAADVDGDGASEIIIAAADGKLHVIGNAFKRRATKR